MSYQLRDYQQKAGDAAFEEWRENTSTLIVLPTAAGKTVTFAAIIQRFQPMRSLVLAHREELIFQAQEKIEALGIKCEVEMGEMSAATGLFGRPQCVIATVHPSSVLRAPDAAARAQAEREFFADLKKVGAALRRASR